MPRTKRPAAKKQENSVGSETEKKKLEKWALKGIIVRNTDTAKHYTSLDTAHIHSFNEQKKKIDIRAQMEARNIELAFKILVGSIPKTHLQMTIGQLRNELHLKEITNTSQTRQSARSASHDDGYNTESSAHGSGERRKKTMAPPSSSGRSMSRRSRSADVSRRGPPSMARAQRRRSRSVYRTPAYNKNASTLYPVITPKVAPHTPLTVLRQPRHGEMVVSMTGSPVMVANFSSVQRDEKANCNIELQDGTVLTVKPTQLRQSQAFIPFALMGPSVLDQIRTLKENLEKMVSLGEKALK